MMFLMELQAEREGADVGVRGCAGAMMRDARADTPRCTGRRRAAFLRRG